VKYFIAIIPPGGMLLTEKWIKRDMEAAPAE
jgi:hypothetical protein